MPRFSDIIIHDDTLQPNKLIVDNVQSPHKEIGNYNLRYLLIMNLIVTIFSTVMASGIIIASVKYECSQNSKTAVQIFYWLAIITLVFSIIIIFMLMYALYKKVGFSDREI